MTLFFICATNYEAEQKALSLRLNGYNTQIKFVAKSSYVRAKIYKVFGERMNRWEAEIALKGKKRKIAG